MRKTTENKGIRRSNQLQRCSFVTIMANGSCRSPPVAVLALTTRFSARARVGYRRHTTAPARLTVSGSTTPQLVKPVDLKCNVLKSSHSFKPQLRPAQTTTSCISKSDSVVTLRPTDKYVDRQNTESLTGCFLSPMESVVNE